MLFVDRRSLKIINELPMPFKEGWGLTHSKEFLYATDGSHILYKIDKHTFDILEKI